MDIFNIPDEVIDAYVLPYLEWNDLLRLRRVCKWTKGITDAYLRVHPELAPEIEINEDDKSFGEFLKMGIPSTRIFLKNTSGDEFYRDGGEDADEFLEEYGKHVKSLRVEQLSILLYGKEWDFLEALPNLQSFEAERYEGHRKGLSLKELESFYVDRHQVARKDPRFNPDGMQNLPVEFFKRLRTLKLGNNMAGSFGADIFGYNENFLSIGKNLDSVALPFDPNAKPYANYNPVLYGRPMALAFAYFGSFVRVRSEDPEVPKLKLIDFVNFHCEKDIHKLVELELWGSEIFMQFCNVCIKNDVKLMNVGSSWFQQRVHEDNLELASPKLGTPVLSLVNLHPSVFPLDIPNLEKIEIQRTSRSTPGLNWQNDRPEWPTLKTLDITVDSRSGQLFEWTEEYELENVNRTATKDLFNFFFDDISRTALTELRLQFIDGLDTLPVPKTEAIVSSCPNLKKLTLINWNGTNKALTKLWEGLPGLEEVSLEGCKNLGNVAFVGNDVENPVFLKLSKLKKLTLGGLDQMPKITDTLFSLVIGQLKLTHLFLTSQAPLKTVTAKGIKSLCDGPFSESVQKFPFKNWSLADVSNEEFQKLQESFRSYYLL